VDEKYAGFRELAEQAKAQKDRVLNAGTGGWEPHSHTLYKTILPRMVAKYGPQKGRNMVTLLAYLHASKVGETAPLSIPVELRGWAMVSNATITADLGMKEGTLIELKKALVAERLLIVRKRPYNGNLKDYYLPFYYPYDGEIVSDYLFG
jgi:hypothetical protein